VVVVVGAVLVVVLVLVLVEVELVGGRVLDAVELVVDELVVVLLPGGPRGTPRDFSPRTTRVTRSKATIKRRRRTLTRRRRRAGDIFLNLAGDPIPFGLRAAPAKVVS
jgi:hypothetical protein